MKREEVLQRLREHLDELRQRFGVKSLAISGSVARGEAGPDSDIDILVEFETSPGFDGYMALKFYLEDLLGKKVDLVMKNALKPWARDAVLREKVDVT
ncbi:nucleotidyltransferase family protein [Candidatus Bipolaricaulota sp. J31]